MKFKSNWNKMISSGLSIRIIVGPIRFLIIDLNFNSDFYSITFINFTLRNR